jgi:Ca-activated chloride channel family protein
MRSISSQTGGLYFRAHKNAELDEIYTEIDKLERTKFSTKQYNKRNELYMPFALAALIVFLLELVTRIFVLKRLP